MEITNRGKRIDLDISLEKGDKCFLTINTIEYNFNNKCGVTIGDIETMKEIGWNDDAIAAIDNLKIGQRYNSENYDGTAFVIRIG